MALDYAPAPVRDPIAEQNPDSGKLMLPRVWIDWFAALGLRVDKQAITVDAVNIPGAGGNIPVTSIPVPTSGAAKFRLSYYLRITTVGTVSSSVEVNFGWTDGGVACTHKFPAVTGNTTSTTQSGSIMVRNDASVLMTYYTTNYASAATATMKYNLDIVAEQI